MKYKNYIIVKHSSGSYDIVEMNGELVDAGFATEGLAMGAVDTFAPDPTVTILMNLELEDK